MKINKSHERSCELVKIRIKITRMFLFCSNCAYDSNPYDSVQNRLSESQKKLSEQLNYNASFKAQEENNFNNLFFTSLARYKKVSHNWHQHFVSVSACLLFTRSQHSAQLIKTSTPIFFLVKTSLSNTIQ